jgi:hypothetical protein
MPAVTMKWELLLNNSKLFFNAAFKSAQMVLGQYYDTYDDVGGVALASLYSLVEDSRYSLPP